MKLAISLLFAVSMFAQQATENPAPTEAAAPNLSEDFARAATKAIISIKNSSYRPSNVEANSMQTLINDAELVASTKDDKRGTDWLIAYRFNHQNAGLEAFQKRDRNDKRSMRQRFDDSLKREQVCGDELVDIFKSGILPEKMPNDCLPESIAKK